MAVTAFASQEAKAAQNPAYRPASHFSRAHGRCSGHAAAAPARPASGRTGALL